MFKKFKATEIIRYAIVFIVTSLVFVFASLFIGENKNKLINFQHSEIKNIASLIDLSKEINNYSKLTRDEIQLLVRKDFSFINQQLLGLSKNLENGLITEFQLNEINNELLSLIRLNKSITDHLGSNEIELAQKLYKTEFLFHEEKIHQLIDSTKKASMINTEIKMNQILSLNSKEKSYIILSISLFFSLFLGVIYFMRKEFNSSRLLNKHLLIIDDKNKLVKNINNEFEELKLNFDRLKLENFNMAKNIKSFKNHVNSFSLTLCNAETNAKTKMENLELNSQQALAQFEQKVNFLLKHHEEFRCDIKQHNQSIISLKQLSQNINKLIVNFEINRKPIDVLELKHILNTVDLCHSLDSDLKDFDLKQSFDSLCILLKEDRHILTSYNDNLRHLEEHIKKVEKENNSNLTKLKSKVLNLDFELLSQRESINEKLI